MLALKLNIKIVIYGFENPTGAILSEKYEVRQSVGTSPKQCLDGVGQSDLRINIEIVMYGFENPTVVILSKNVRSDKVSN